MKCKRCRATVPDDAERCPSCGQDLSSLRQLLSDFYSDEPTRFGEGDAPPREPEVFPAEEEKPPDLLALKDERLLSGYRLREKMALAIMYLIGYGYYHNKPRWTAGSLVKHLRLPLKYIQDTLEALSDHGMILMVSEDMSYLPAMDLEKITVNDILAAVRIETGERNGILKRIEALSAIDAVMARIDEAVYRSVENETLKDFVIPGVHRQ